MLPEDRLSQIVQRFEFLEAQLNAGAAPDQIARISREYAELKPVVEQIARWRDARAGLADAEAMLADPEMRDLAADELARLREEMPALEQALRIALLPKDAADARPAMIEIRPGTGGDEAALFAGDLLTMYRRYAESQGWTFQLLELSESELGGVREAVARIEGEGATVLVQLRLHGGAALLARITQRSVDALRLAPGVRCHATVKSAGLVQGAG